MNTTNCKTSKNDAIQTFCFSLKMYTKTETISYKTNCQIQPFSITLTTAYVNILNEFEFHSTETILLAC